MKKTEGVRVTIDDYLSLPYTIELTQDEQVGWFAQIRELVGCASDGKTPEEAVSSVREAMCDWIRVGLDNGDDIPLPKSMRPYNGKFLVRTSPSLHRRLTEQAEDEGVSTNQLCATILAEGEAVGADFRELVTKLAAKLDELGSRLDKAISAGYRESGVWHKTPQVNESTATPKRRRSAASRTLKR
jgi:antitoxin HicB